MKQLLIIISVITVSCCSTKSTKNAGTENSQAVDSSIVAATPLPACIDKLIERFKAEEITNPPRKIYSYTYKGKTVFYVPALCCDFYSELYDTSCTVIGHPDGGFTGRGDGTMTDFDSTKTNEKLIWADERGGKGN